MPENRLSNLKKDLTKAKQQALLIEVLQSDLDSWADQGSDVFRTICDTCSAVFDSDVKKGKTNVLVVDEGDYQEPTSIFRSLLGSLDHEFDDIHKREILAKLTGFGLNQAFGGAVGSAVTDSLSVGAEKMMEYVAEWSGSASESVASIYEAGVDAVVDGSASVLETIGETSAEAITGQFCSDDEIYLSRPARTRLKELAPRLSKKATSHEALQLALEMLLVTAQGAPKVIVVKDPFRLDDASLALLAMLVSQEKDVRQSLFNLQGAANNRPQTAGISVVLTFTGIQPQENVNQEVFAERQRAISRLRMMASRYSLLERLDSDIPAPAVRSSTFVGRERELESLRRDWNSFRVLGAPVKQSWHLIRGEPGTGKTALANRFIQEIRSDKSDPARLFVPALRILNQAGHGAQTTGLASLKNSVVEELKRLSSLYRKNVGWVSQFKQSVEDVSRDCLKDITSTDHEARKRTLARVGHLVSKLTGIDTAADVVTSVKGWNNRSETLLRTAETFGKSSKINHKENEYELLREGLQAIYELARRCREGIESGEDGPMPLLLLVDDVQWMDDFVAEFMLNEWPVDLPVYVIATARGSDSFSTTGDSHAHQLVNQNRNQLFADLGLIEVENGAEEVIGPRGHDRLALGSCVNLKGMDRQMLSVLIGLTFDRISEIEAQEFAASVINSLSSDHSASEVVTLFAVETLNVISDPRFYQRNPGLVRLIIPARNSDRYEYQAPTDTTLKEALKALFDDLKKIYEESYFRESRHEHQGASFNLASHAVLEERLHIIEEYFGENGGNARYSLMFSALLGSPFQSEFVQQVIEHLKQLEPHEFEDLAPFLLDFQANVSGYFCAAHYELLERAYEIIRRLEQNTTASSKYVYQHSLLQQFLLAQVTLMLKRIYPTGDAFENGLGELVMQIWECGSIWFPAHAEALPRERVEPLIIDWLWALVALTGYGYRINRDDDSAQITWDELYASNLCNLASFLAEGGRVHEALPLIEEAMLIQRTRYKNSPKDWAENYVKSLNTLTLILIGSNRSLEALPLTEEAYSIAEEGYHTDKQAWSKQYVLSLERRVGALNATRRPDEALPLAEEYLSISREGCEIDSESWRAQYFGSLASLSVTFVLLGQPERALPLQEEIQSAQHDIHGGSPEAERASFEYVGCLLTQAQTLRAMGHLEEALPVAQKAYSVVHRWDEISADRWEVIYPSILSVLGGILSELGHVREALPLDQEALSIIGQYYEGDPQNWSERYSMSLTSLARTYAKQGLEREALRMHDDALRIFRKDLANTPECPSISYAEALKATALTLTMFGRWEEALAAAKEALELFRQQYQELPESGAIPFVAVLGVTAQSHSKLGDHEAAHALFQEAISICRPRRDSAPHQLLMNYAKSLNGSVSALIAMGRFEEAIPLAKESLSVTSAGNESSPSLWARQHAQGLNLLARTYLELGRPIEALPLCEAGLKLFDQEAESSSTDESWVIYYSMTKMLTGGAYLRLGRLSEALPHLEEVQLQSERGYENDPELWSDIYIGSLNSIASICLASGYPREAIPALQTAQIILRDNFDCSSIVYAGTLANLGTAQALIGQVDEALPLFEEALPIFQKTYGSDPKSWNFDYVQYLIAYGRCLLSSGKSDDAILIFKDVLLFYRNHLKDLSEEQTIEYTQVLATLELIIGDTDS